MAVIRVDSKYRKYSRIPYKEGGRSIEGVDCYGLVKLILEQEHDVKDLINYGPGLSHKDDQDIIKATFEEAIASKYWKKLDYDELHSPPMGTVLWIHFMSEYHVGIVVGEWTMMHTMDEMGTVIEDFRGKRWEHRILGFYEWTPD